MSGTNGTFSCRNAPLFALQWHRMGIIVYSASSVLLSELAFLLGYLSAYLVYSLTDLALLLFRRIFRKTHAALAGIVCGASGGFCAFSVAHMFSRLSGATGSWLLVLSMGLPAIGLLSYLRNSLRRVATGYSPPYPLYGRLHAAIMAIPIRVQFELVKSLLEQHHREQVGAEDDPLGHIAYREATRYSCIMTIFSVLGVIIGVFLAWPG